MICKYKATNEKLANLALLMFKNHFWYLSVKLVALSFFDDEFRHEMKGEMKQALTKPSDLEPPKKTQIEIDSIKEKELADFLTSNNVFFQHVRSVIIILIKKC